MTRVRRPLVAVVALFTIAIALDRVGVDHGAGAIDSIVYALAAIAVISPMLLPGVGRARPWAFALLTIGAYGAIVGLTGWDRLGAGPMLATELAFLVIATRLGHHLATTLETFEETLGAIAFGESSMSDIESAEASDQILDELARSRRHDRPLTLTVIAPTPEGMAAAAEAATIEIDHVVRRRYVQGRLARAVGSRLRRSDILFEHRASGRLFVISPETDPDGSELLRKRIAEAATAAGVPAATGVACFPDEAIGFETLVELAESDLDSHLHATPHLRAVQHGAGR